MGKTYEQIDASLAEFLAAQHLFFVATAPLAADGHINLSPRGLDTFRVLGPTTVAFVDLTGSGAETIAHLRDNGRITLMFCAFAGPPKIVRLQGHGAVILPDSPEYANLAPELPTMPGQRAIIRVECERISDSCGYGVPLMQYQGERSQLVAWAEKKGPTGLDQYQHQHNRRSVDGLPALD